MSLDVDGADALAQLQAERRRVVRDIHDVVGHGLTAICVQANFALLSVQRDPERVPEILQSIKSSASAALAELRVVLTRPEFGDPASGTAAPGLADVPVTAARLVDTGMTVRVVGDTDIDVPAATGLTVYRVVQESLANALRHGTGREADVAVSATTDRLDVTVTNPLPGDARPRCREGAGLGLPGMRDRVHAVGGTLTVVRGRDTFKVHASLPRS
ncbi:MAG: histidine kinase [Actinomycetia bacterium]|nr:histidine kinase [Actinomycetes bacterium]